MRHTALLTTALLATTALSVTFATAAPPASVIPATGINYAYGLSGDGKTVVGFAGTSLSPQAEYWSDGTLVNPLVNPSGASAFTGISGDGSTLFGHFQIYPDDQPFVLRGNTVTHLPELGSAAELTASNYDGSVIVGYGPAPGTSAGALMWSGPNWSTITNLGALPGQLASTALGISGTSAANAAQSIIVGQSVADDANSHAVYWQNLAIHDLGTNGFSSSAMAISGDANTIVGTSYPDSNSSRAVSWTGPGYTTMTDLGSLGGAFSFAQEVSGDGSVIVGTSTLVNDTKQRAFRYANGHMDDLTTLLANAGVDMNGVILAAPAGISTDGRYIAANDQFFDQAYLAFYDDGIGGLTNGAEQQASVDALGKQRQALAVQYDAYSGILIGDLDRQDPGGMVGVFGLVGSAVGGARGHAGLGNGFSLNAGLADGSSELGGAGIGNGVMGAISLRYDASALALGRFHPFAQVAGSFAGLGGINFSRPYQGGTGTGETDGRLGSALARLGISGDLDGGDEISLAGEIGERWLTTDAYDEGFSASNPFPASIAAGTDSQAVAKLSATWSHRLGDNLDLTVRAAVGKTIGGTSGLKVATTGFGMLGAGIDQAVWGEAGAHLTYSVNSQSAIDFYATGTTGGATTAASGHIGAGYHYSF